MMLRQSECRALSDALWRYAEHNVSDAERTRIEAHLNACPTCAEQARAYRRTAEATGVCRETPLADPIGTWSALRSRIEMEGRRLPARSIGARQPVLVWSAVGAAAAIALLACFTTWRTHDSGPIHVASRPTPTQKLARHSESGHVSPRVSPTPADNHVMQQSADRRDLQAPQDAPRRVAVRGPANRAIVPQQSHMNLPRPVGDDLAYINPGESLHLSGLARFKPDAIATLKARIDQTIRTGDDFVSVPFPRIAGLGDRAIAAALESYRQEKEVIDARLSRNVTLGAKGMSLSDLCAQLKKQTGIEITAAPSVADDKATIFCKEKPLRDLMRQIDRVFGFRWRRTGENGAYQYELFQDLKSRLLEEELRNKDTNEALLALDAEMERYRKYLGLSPEEAKAKAQNAPADEKEMLEKYAGSGWGPAHLYSQLTPDQMSALRSGDALRFGAGDEGGGAQPLPAGLGSGILQSLGDTHIALGANGGGSIGPASRLPNGTPPAATPGAQPMASLQLGHDELGQFSLVGGSGVMVPFKNGSMASMNANDLATGESPSVRNPNNAATNAKLASDPTVQRKVTIKPEPSCTLAANPYLPHRQAPPDAPSPYGQRVTMADVMEAIHKATGADIVADYYTRLYRPEAVVEVNVTLFEALNRICDAMRVRWSREDGWLQFRSTGYFNDRLKEVPNRLLERWSSLRRERGGLSPDEIVEMAALTDAQLDSRSMADGVRAIYNLSEWDIARSRQIRPHWRFLAGLSQGTRKSISSQDGIKLGALGPAEQQRFVSQLIAPTRTGRNVRLEDVPSATMRLEYGPPRTEPAAATTETPTLETHMEDEKEPIRFTYRIPIGEGRVYTWKITPTGESSSDNERTEARTTIGR